MVFESFNDWFIKLFNHYQGRIGFDGILSKAFIIWCLLMALRLFPTLSNWLIYQPLAPYMSVHFLGKLVLRGTLLVCLTKTKMPFLLFFLIMFIYMYIYIYISWHELRCTSLPYFHVLNRGLFCQVIVCLFSIKVALTLCLASISILFWGEFLWSGLVNLLKILVWWLLFFFTYFVDHHVYYVFVSHLWIYELEWMYSAVFPSYLIPPPP